MSEEIQPPRSHPAVVASLAIAGIAVAVCALLAIAYFVGWLPTSRAPSASVPASEARPAAKAPQTARTQSGVVLLPGETLVTPPDPMPAPAPAPNAAPTSAPDRPPAFPAAPRYARPAPTPPPPPIAKPSPRPPPQYSREERRPDSYDRSTRSVCLNCGVVTAITRGDYDWEVRVRFDDGRRETLRYYDRPRFRVADAVRLEDGRLIPD